MRASANAVPKSLCCLRGYPFAQNHCAGVRFLAKWWQWLRSGQSRLVGGIALAMQLPTQSTWQHARKAHRYASVWPPVGSAPPVRARSKRSDPCVARSRGSSDGGQRQPHGKASTSRTTFIHPQRGVRTTSMASCGRSPRVGCRSCATLCSVSPCTVRTLHEAGDHSLFVAAIGQLTCRGTDQPLTSQDLEYVYFG